MSDAETLAAVLFRHDAAAPEWVRVPKGDGLLEAMYKLIDCDIVEPSQLSDVHVLYMDEEAHLNHNANKPNECFHKFAGQPAHSMFFGNILLLKCDAETGEHEESLTQADLDSCAGFVKKDLEARTVNLRDLGVHLGVFLAPAPKSGKSD